MTSVFLFLFSLFIVFGSLAEANCPSPYDDDSCNSECVRVFNGAGEDSVKCDFTDETGSVEAHTVTDYDGVYGTPNYSIFGETPSGGEFCCWFDDPANDITLVWLDGSDYDDFLECNWAEENLYYLPGDQDYTVLACRIDGHEGEDTIDGSDDGAGEINLIQGCLHDECDFLLGNAHVDHIHAFDGGDWAAGGGGGDTLHGGGGDDIMFGDEGPDTLNGNGGDDLMTGEEGDDIVKGHTGADQLLGGDDDDVLCGGGGTGDVLSGDAGVDALWVPDTTSITPTGTAGNVDHCGDISGGFGSWAGASCIYDLDTTDRPAECF